MSRPDDAWFVVARAPGKISAMPVSGKGWVALAAFVAVALCLGWSVMRLLADWHPAAAVPVLLLCLTAAILGFFRWVVIPHARRHQSGAR